MSTLFEEAVLKARQLPDEEQDELAAALFAQMSGQRLTPDQVEEVRAIRARLASGDEDIVPDSEMAAFWRHCGL
jgi:hypothetical protein